MAKDWHVEAVGLRREGLSYAQIAAKLGRTKESTYNAIDRYKRPTVATTTGLPLREMLERRAEARRMHARGTPITHIMAAMRMPYREVMIAIETKGVVT